MLFLNYSPPSRMYLSIRCLRSTWVYPFGKLSSWRRGIPETSASSNGQERTKERRRQDGDHKSTLRHAARARPSHVATRSRQIFLFARNRGGWLLTERTQALPPRSSCVSSFRFPRFPVVRRSPEQVLRAARRVSQHRKARTRTDSSALA